MGIGLDNLETAGPPDYFEVPYQLAGKGGLKRNGHSSEHAPVAINTIACLDLSGCRRTAYGYFVMADDDVIARVREHKTPFTDMFGPRTERAQRHLRRRCVLHSPCQEIEES